MAASANSGDHDEYSIFFPSFFPIGFTGSNCHVDIDECSSNPCRNGGVCTDLINSFRCTCPIGFAGERCDQIVNDCGYDNPCLNGGTCRNNGYNSYVCDCQRGFSGHRCENTQWTTWCSSNPCQNRGRCIERLGSYTCQCLPGTRGKHCEVNENDCINNPCINGECVDGINNYQVIEENTGCFTLKWD